MKMPYIYDMINKDFGHVIALYSTVLISSGVIISPSYKDLSDPVSREKKLLKSFDNLLWELDEKDRALCLKIRSLWYDFETCKMLHGLGGCTKKTLKELVEES